MNIATIEPDAFAANISEMKCASLVASRIRATVKTYQHEPYRDEIMGYVMDDLHTYLADVNMSAWRAGQYVGIHPTMEMLDLGWPTAFEVKSIGPQGVDVVAAKNIRVRVEDGELRIPLGILTDYKADLGVIVIGEATVRFEISRVVETQIYQGINQALRKNLANKKLLEAAHEKFK